jgi:hypothetical protein
VRPGEWIDSGYEIGTVGELTITADIRASNNRKRLAAAQGDRTIYLPTMG